MTPAKNSMVATNTVGTTQRRSLGRRAGRKNARICQMIMGVHMASATLMAMLNLIEKPPSEVMTESCSPGCREPLIGSLRMSTSVGAAKYMKTVAASTDTTTMVRRRRSSPR